VNPTPEEIRALHKEIAPSAEAFELVYTHCEIVWSIADQLIRARDLAVDVELVRAGCLLHDIGVHLLNGESYIRHGVLGEAFLRERGFPDPLSRFCAHHTGVGITRDDVLKQSLPLPVADFLADSAEERLVMYADKFHSKTTPPVFVTAPTYERQVRKFGPQHTARFAALISEFGLPDLTALATHFGHATV
jgi:uncharacterized protein